MSVTNNTSTLETTTSPENNDGSVNENNDSHIEDIKTGLIGISGTFGIVSTASTMTIAEAGNSVKAIKGLTAVSKIGSGSGILGLALTGSVVVYEHQNGQANTHTLVDASIAVVGVVGAAVALTVGAPVVATGIIIGGTVYGRVC